MKSLRFLPLITLSACVVASPSAMAQTMGDYVERQQTLSSLDFDIERQKRQIELKELAIEFRNVGKPEPAPEPRQQMDRQVQFFGNPAAMNGANAPEEPPRKSEADLRKERELALLTGASIIEVFRATPDSDTLVAVLNVDREPYEVKPGDRISTWRVTDIALDEVRLVNAEFNAAKTIKHIR